jgi:anti-anti-sigma factor
MMGSGKVLYAADNGTYVIKLVGDVRVPLCVSLDHFIETLFNNDKPKAILIDLTDSTAIDSTALGMLAKIAIYLQDRRQHKATIISTNPDISRIISTMGFEQVFSVVYHNTACANCCDELPHVETDEIEITKKVLEAHRRLMALNQNNKDTFKCVVDALELEQQVAMNKDNRCNQFNRLGSVR